jgi:FkbM family methyltransferase
MKNSKFPIYSRLGDEESRYLFDTCLRYRFNHELKLYNITRKSAAYKKLQEIKKDFFMFGAGYSGHLYVNVFSEIPWRAFIDNDNSKIGKLDILPIISFQEFIKNSENANVFIPNTPSWTEMKQQLISNGFPEDSIIHYYGSSHFFIQYFDLPYFKPKDKEFFIDAGGYDGYSTQNFFNWLAGKSGRSIIFEPNQIQYEICKNNVQDYDNVKVVNKGLWHKKETLKFCNGGTGSFINSNGKELIEAISLDEELKDEKEPVTFIKMDIEGAELNALKGAERTIREQRPKLAICIYHKPEDVQEIPSLLLDYVPDYKFYIRHYSFSTWETVLYAI